MSYYNISLYHVTPSAWDARSIIDEEGKSGMKLWIMQMLQALSLSSPFLAMGLKWHTVFLIGLNVEKLKEAQDSTASQPSLLIIRNTIHNIMT